MVTFWNLPPLVNVLIVLVIAAAVVVAGVYVLTAAVRAAARGRAWERMLERRTRLPFTVLVAVVLAWIGLGLTLPGGEWRVVFRHVSLVVLILSITWVVGAVLLYFSDLGLSRYASDGSDGWQARRARTQVAVVQRLIGAATVVIGIGAALLTFPGVQALGTTVLASAGFLSVVAGLAAQSTLGNLFAGMQLAFSGAVRLEDVVVVNGEWGYIEEITLTYVVVRIWDERRLVLPSTYFTQQPYENWTRHSTAVLGTVYFDLDWGVDVLRMRAELDRILDESGLWDGQASSLRVTDAVGGFVQVRALVSADDAFKMFDLSRTVREEMLLWLQKENPEGLPRTRIQTIERDGEKFPRRKPTRVKPDAAVEQDDEHPGRGDETKPIRLVQAREAAAREAAGEDAADSGPVDDERLHGPGAPDGSTEGMVAGDGAGDHPGGDHPGGDQPSGDQPAGDGGRA